MKKNFYTLRTALIETCSKKTFRILKLVNLLLLVTVLSAFGELQQNRITGTVTDTEGSPLAGVNVVVTGSTIGTITDAEGKFSLDAPPGAKSLTFTFIGLETQEVPIGASRQVNVTMTETAVGLSEVVVTALGIRREAKSIGYSTASVDNQQIAVSRVTNVGNSLVGKVAGMNVSAPTSGAGGSSKIRIRGQSSFGGYNSPLIIVNGVPFNNTSIGATSGAGTNPNTGSSDSGDGLQSINPDDIESMTVLKSTAAAALYGYRAKDGAIIITTKSGVGTKGIGVEFNTNIQQSHALDYTDYQYEYGQGENGVRPTSTADAQSSGVWSFGEKFDGVPTPQFDGSVQPYSPHDNRIRDYFRPALSLTNSLALTGGNENGSFRLSYANTYAENIVPNSDFKKNILNLGIDYNLSPRLSVSLNVNYSNEYNRNPPQVGTESGAIATTMGTLANSIDINWMKNYLDENGNEMPLARFTGRNNPYWIAYKHFENVKRDRLFGNATVRYQFTDWLYAMGRVGQDYFTRPTDFARPTGSRNLPSAVTGFNGFYYQDVSTFREFNMDFLVGAQHSFGDIGLDLTLGGNRMDQTNTRMGTSVTDFYVRDLYTIGNGITKNPGYFYSQKKVNSLYGTLEASFRSILFLNFTARNDWFSTLNPESNSYLYPSASLSFVFSDALATRPGWLDFGKFRVAYAEVGGDTDPYTNALYYGISANQLNGIGIGSITTNISPNTNLRPLKVKEAEVGFELRTFNSRVNLDLSVYQKNTVDEILNVSISKASGYDQTLVNIGRLRNSGVEMMLTLVPVEGDFTWETGFNNAYNTTEVVELAGGQTRFLVANGYWFGFIAHEVGQPLASVQAFDYRRDEQGRILSSGGKPLLGDLKTFGSGVPKWTGAWTNTFMYRGLRIFTQVDYKAGAVLLSNSNFNGLRHGLTKSSLPGREDGVVMEGFNDDGTPNSTAVPAQEWYSSIRGLGEPFIYKADFIRWRTLSVGYDLGQVIKTPAITGITVSLFINNVAMIKKYLDNYDPEAQFAVSDNFQGLEIHTLPTTRSYGINLNVKF